MRWSWIDLNFPWIGSIAAVVVLILLFSTNRLRSDLKQSRWRNISWFSWLGVAIYLRHNVEEYGVDLLGQFHAFPRFMCAMLAQPPYPSCPIPAPFYLAVNLPLFWVCTPVAAILSRRHPILGSSVYGVIFVNALTHLGAFVRSGYNPGVLTGIFDDDWLPPALAEQQSECRGVRTRAKQIVCGGEIEVQLSCVLGLELTDQNFDDEIAVEPNVIKEQVEKEHLTADFKWKLATDENESPTELQEKVAEMNQ